MARFAFYFSFLILFSFTIASIESCGGSSTPSPDFGISSQNCGNGSIDAAESCDDGNGNNSDGCNANCAWEVGEAICGNGVKENEECCDDGNNLSGDGCSIVCTSEKNNRTPAAPQLSVEPANGVTWAPTRLYLSWNPSADLDAGDQITYDVYFILKGSRESIPAGILPYKTGIASTHFIIQASTDNRAEYFPDQVSAIYLSPDNSYLWKVCARDSSGAQNCSETRTFNTDNSVVGWWRFDENSGQVCPGILGGPAGDAGETVCDYSGFGNHGRASGAPMWVAPDSNILGGAFQFDGVDDWIQISNNAILSAVEGFTLSCKLKPSRTITSMSIITKDDPASGPFALTQNDLNQIAFEIFTTTWNRAYGNAESFFGTYLRVAGVYTGTLTQLYFNDLLMESTPTTSSVANNLNNLKIAYNPFNTSFNRVQIDECVIMNKTENIDERLNNFHVDSN